MFMTSIHILSFSSSPLKSVPRFLLYFYPSVKCWYFLEPSPKLSSIMIFFCIMILFILSKILYKFFYSSLNYHFCVNNYQMYFSMPGSSPELQICMSSCQRELRLVIGGDLYNLKLRIDRSSLNGLKARTSQKQSCGLYKFEKFYQKRLKILCNGNVRPTLRIALKLSWKNYCFPFYKVIYAKERINIISCIVFFSQILKGEQNDILLLPSWSRVTILSFDIYRCFETWHCEGARMGVVTARRGESGRDPRQLGGETMTLSYYEVQRAELLIPFCVAGRNSLFTILLLLVSPSLPYKVCILLFLWYFCFPLQMTTNSFRGGQ